VRAALCIACCLLAAPSFGAGVEVISPRPDAVSVTIYRDLFALVTETRIVDLPEGDATLSFDGVVETLLPASTVLTGTGRELAERNYDYDELTPSALFAKSIGRKVLLTRTTPGTGVVRQVEATLVAARPGGIVFQTAEGAQALHCSGVPEHAIFEEVPGELRAQPRLSVRLAAGPAGRRTLTLSYLAHGFAWKADYVARLRAAGTSADLRGWVTLRNLTNATLRDAHVQVVAGRLHLVGGESEGTSVFGDTDDLGDDDGYLRYTRERALQDMADELEPASPDLQLFTGCFGTRAITAEDIGRFPDGNLAESLQRVAGERLEEVVVTGISQAQQERLADYHLYRIPWPTDLNARQTKQVAFLQKPAVEVRRFYRAFVDAIDHYEDPELTLQSPQIVLGFENRKTSGLGEALPEGVLRLYEAGADADLFAGEGEMRDTAVGQAAEVEFAHAVDLTYTMQVDDGVEADRDGEETADLADAAIRISNARAAPVEVEVRQSMNFAPDGAAVTRASLRTLRKHGDYAWTVRLPPNGNGTLTYRVRVPHTPERETD
jgi:hypothetical protein